MVSNCTISVLVNGYTFPVDVKDNYVELFGDIITDSLDSCIFIGPIDTPVLEPQDIKLIKKGKRQAMNRKCKTVLKIKSKCNQDVLRAIDEEGAREKEAHHYLRTFIEAHLAVINSLIQHYRLSTYDLFPYELSPWDVPIWFIGWEGGSKKIILQDYAGFDFKPRIIPIGKPIEDLTLIDADKLQLAMENEPSPGEFELLDALNLMERGDYSGAVRRVITAIETQLGFVLRQELLKTYTPFEVDSKLKASESDFPGRLRQYEKLSGRKLNKVFSQELDTMRDIRHSIVHRAYRIPFELRERQAQKAVDFGRWIFNWIENQPAKKDIREKFIVKRSLGRHISMYDFEIISSGVVVRNLE
jgi:hypothetical protein